MTHRRPLALILAFALPLFVAHCRRAAGQPSSDAGGESTSTTATGEPPESDATSESAETTGEPRHDDATWRRERSLDPFYSRVARDLRDGEPLVVAAYYGMWFDNADDPDRNINWGMRFGHATMMRRADSDAHVAKHYRHRDWSLALEQERDEPPIRTLVFEQTISPNDRWRERGVEEPFEMYVALQAFPSRTHAGTTMVRNLRRGEARELELDDGTMLDLADAQAVGYFGHNFFYDFPDYDWDGFERIDGRPDRPRALFAVGCKTARVPGFPALVGHNVNLLLASRSLMASEGYTTLALLDGLARALPGRRLVDLADRTYKYFQHLTKPDRKIGDLFVSHPYRMYPDHD